MIYVFVKNINSESHFFVRIENTFFEEWRFFGTIISPNEKKKILKKRKYILKRQIKSVSVMHILALKVYLTFSIICFRSDNCFSSNSQKSTLNIYFVLYLLYFKNQLYKFLWNKKREKYNGNFIYFCLRKWILVHFLLFFWKWITQKQFIYVLFKK